MDIEIAIRVLLMKLGESLDMSIPTFSIIFFIIPTLQQYQVSMLHEYHNNKISLLYNSSTVKISICYTCVYVFFLNDVRILRDAELFSGESVKFRV